MRLGKIADLRRLSALVAVSYIAAFATNAYAFEGVPFVATDGAQGGERAFGDGETEGPGTAQQRPDLDEPSEDGTDETPNAASRRTFFRSSTDLLLSSSPANTPSKQVAMAGSVLNNPSGSHVLFHLRAGRCF